MITTERLVLHPLTFDEADLIGAGDVDARHETWAEGYPTPGSRRAAAAFTNGVDRYRAITGFGIYWIVRVHDGVVVGDIGFHSVPTADGEVEVGFSVASSCRRAGVATEALRGLVAWAAVQPAVRRIVARTDPDNVASRTVLGCAGFHRMAPDSVVWELVPGATASAPATGSARR